MRTGSLADLGAEPGMPSLPSLQRFVAGRGDFPLIERGRYGLPYRFDLDVAAAFVREHWRDGRRRSAADEAHRAAERARQQCLPGFGPPVPDDGAA